MGISISKAFPLPLGGDYVGNAQWKLTKPFEYVNPPIIVEVPIGFVTDGASIPKFVWSVLGSPWSGKYARAAVIHDYLCVVKTYPQSKIDYIFYQGMRILKVSYLKRTLMYLAVRVFHIFK